MIAKVPHRLPTTLIFIAVLAAGHRVSAEPVTFQFTGAVTDAAAYVGESSTFSSLFPIGTSVIYTLTYDTTWPAMDCPCISPQYAFDASVPTAQFNYALQIGGHEYWRSTELGVAFLKPTEIGMSVDTSLSGVNLDGDIVGSQPAWHPAALDAFFPMSELAFSGQLPTDLMGVLEGRFDLYLLADSRSCPSCGANAVVGGRLTSVEAVPSPSTLLMVVLGSSGILVRYLRRLGNRDGRQTKDI